MDRWYASGCVMGSMNDDVLLSRTATILLVGNVPKRQTPFNNLNRAKYEWRASRHRTLLTRAQSPSVKRAIASLTTELIKIEVSC